MHRVDIAAGVLRLISAWVFLKAIQFAPATFGFMFREAMPVHETIIFSIYLLLELALAAVLWFCAEWIAKKLMPAAGAATAGSEPGEQDIAPAMLLSVALALMGVWFLVISLIDLSYWVAMLEVRRRMSFPPDFPWSPDRIATAVSFGVQIVVAIALIFGSGGLTRLLFLLRYGPNSARLGSIAREDDSRAAEPVEAEPRS